jgi:hypothetical protein
LALALADNPLKEAKLPAATILGHKGGSVTAKRGSAYFRKLAARRKMRKADTATAPGDQCNFSFKLTHVILFRTIGTPSVAGGNTFMTLRILLVDDNTLVA